MSKKSTLIMEQGIAKCPVCGTVVKESEEGKYESHCNKCGADFFVENKSGIEQVNKTTSDISKYPALKSISGFYNFIAKLSVIAAVIGFIYGVILLDSRYTETQGIIMMISSIIYGPISYLVFKAIAEGILLFINIANDLSDVKNSLQ
tara:strand:- start:82 stop:525 length:444 start_codon:yes stop_codon:yes gene_type:complete